MQLPVIARLAGTNAEGAKKVIDDSGLPIQGAIDLDDAAKSSCIPWIILNDVLKKKKYFSSNYVSFKTILNLYSYP